jgi:hypothetical protein
MKRADSKKFKDFIFVDLCMIDKFVEQTGDVFAEVDKKSWKLSASITGPAVEVSKTKEHIPLKTHEKIDLIERLLRSQGDLYEARPDTIPAMDNARPRFVVETALATKVVLPLTGTASVKGLSSVSVWVSDPDPALYINEPYDWRGTFLYLCEIHWDSATAVSFLSGVSALQVVVNFSRGVSFFDIIADEFEPFGRARDLHPVDKLKEIGGVVMDKRRIRSLYRIRYFTNEQSYKFEGQKRRVNDLLGYPLYILSES